MNLAEFGRERKATQLWEAIGTSAVRGEVFQEPRETFVKKWIGRILHAGAVLEEKPAPKTRRSTLEVH
jgi:hypothetical protein